MSHRKSKGSCFKGKHYTRVKAGVSNCKRNSGGRCGNFSKNQKKSFHFQKKNLHFCLSPITMLIVMALYVEELSPDERTQLQQIANGNDAIQARWAQIVLLSASGIGVPKIADTLGVSAATVRARIKAFNQQRMAAMQRGASPGRPETISPSLGDKFAALMREREPRDFGWADTGWTLDMLVKVATVEGWVESISREGVRLALRKSKHSYRKLKDWRRKKRTTTTIIDPQETP
jgi:transposase